MSTEATAIPVDMSYKDIYIAAVDPARLVMSVAAIPKSKTEKDGVVAEALMTEDAKRLALRHAVKLGWREPSLKATTIMYGDPVKPGKGGIPGGDSKMTPYLFLEFFNDFSNIYEPVGDL